MSMVRNNNDIVDKLRIKDSFTANRLIFMSLKVGAFKSLTYWRIFSLAVSQFDSIKTMFCSPNGYI